MKALLFTVLSCLALLPSPARAESPCEGVQKAVEMLQQAGFIMRVERDWHAVYVSRDWYNTPIDQKRNVIKGIATCMASGVLTVYDGFSGEKLGGAGPFIGFKVYK